MAASAGRSVKLAWDGEDVLGVREKGITLNGEAINVTSDDDDGWRTLLDVSAEDSVDISLSGVTKDEVLRAAYFAGAAARTKEVTLTYQSGAVITGTFFLANFSETGPYNDALTFSATLQSSGPVTYTPAAGG